MESREELLQRTDEQAALFGALADPTRLRLVKRLQRQHEQDALCVNALALILGVSQSAVSQHLRVLKNIGLVRGERRGYHTHYFINQNVLNELRKLASAALSMRESDSEQLGSEHCPERSKQDVSTV